MGENQQLTETINPVQEISFTPLGNLQLHTIHHYYKTAPSFCIAFYQLHVNDGAVMDTAKIIAAQEFFIGSHISRRGNFCCIGKMKTV